MTNESSSRIQPFIKQKNMEYLIAIGGANAYRARGIPAAWLIGASGKVLWQGHPAGLSESTIEGALDKVRLPPQVTLTIKKLSKAGRHVRSQRLDSAIEELENVIRRQKDEDPSSEAKTARDSLLAFGNKLLEETDAQAAKGNWIIALKRLAAVEQYFKKHKLAKQAKDKRSSWKKDRTTRLEVEAATTLMTAERYAASGSKVGAQQYAAKIARGRKYAKTQMRAKAQKMLEELRR